MNARTTRSPMMINPVPTTIAVRPSVMRRTLCSVLSRLVLSRSIVRLIALLLSLLAVATSHAQTEPQVSLPLSELAQLTEGNRSHPPLFAFQPITADVVVSNREGHASAIVTYRTTIQSYSDKPLFVPLVPQNLTIRSLTVKDTTSAIARSDGHAGMVLTTTGNHPVVFVIEVDASDVSDALDLGIPSIHREAMNLSLRSPKELGVPSITPSEDLSTSSSEQVIALTAHIPATDATHLRYARVSGAPWSIGHVDLAGAVTRTSPDSFGSSWTTTVSVDLFRDETIQIPLVADSVALRRVTSSAAVVPLVSKDGMVHAVISGRGAHKITLEFDVPASFVDGAPSLRVPVVTGATRSITVTMPGDQDVKVEPSGGFSRTVRDGVTTLSASLPKTSFVDLSWREALPEQQEKAVAMTAAVWHRFRCEENVLIGQARIDLTIRQGGLDTLVFTLPAEAQVDTIEPSTGTVIDWRSERGSAGSQTVTAYLDRRLEQEAVVAVTYDMPLPSGTQKPLPLISVPQASRNRGAVALIGTRDAALRVAEESTLTRIGESTFPTDLVSNLPGKMTFGFKYGDTPSVLNVSQTPPQRVEGRYNTSLDQVVSVGEVGLMGSVEGIIDIKAGRLAVLQLSLPLGLQVLSVTAPSLRDHRVLTHPDHQIVEIEFTQELEGSIRFELTYEQLLAQDFADATVPVIHVVGADVDRGRIAIESRSATEVTPATAVSLTSEDPAELPQALVARTSHPILKAYSYIWTDAQPPQLTLTLKRHRKQDLPPAHLSTTQYQTQVSTDGTVVTTVDLTVHNVREQFLRVSLPSGASFLNLTVNGRTETPVVADGESDTFLLKLVTNDDGFPVRFSYQETQKSLIGISNRHYQLPILSLSSQQEQWQISLPQHQRVISHRGPFDDIRLTPYQVFASRGFSAAGSLRSMDVISIGDSLDWYLNLLSIVLLPLLYGCWRTKTFANHIRIGISISVATVAGVLYAYHLLPVQTVVGALLVIVPVAEFVLWRKAKG